MLTILSASSFDEVYAILDAAFPEDEHRDYDGQKHLLGKKEYQLLALPFSAVDATPTEGQTIAALLAVWDFDDFAYIEHFAVRKELRSLGLGGRLLDELAETLRKPIVLECEPPAANDMAARRIGFYERHGFALNPYPYIQPSMGEGRSPIPLLLMTHPAAIDEQTFVAYRNTLYEMVYGVKKHKNPHEVS